MKSMLQAPSSKLIVSPEYPSQKAPSAPLADSPGYVSNLSFADVQIHYSGDVVQCHDFFTNLAGKTADEIIDAIFRVLNINGLKAAALKNQHMNFNEINGRSPARLTGSNPVREATVYDFIQAQLAQISPPQPEPSKNDDSTFIMKTGVILNGVSRMLAHKLGDMSASDKIQHKIMERLTDAQDTPAEDTTRKKINAFAQENPVLMYLHNEINAHDASVLLLERTAALKEESEKDEAARKRIFDLMEQQALTQIMALKHLQTPNTNVASMRISRLYFEDPIGLYSQSFIERTAAENGIWSTSAQADIAKLKRTFLQIPANTPAGKHIDNPTLEKAKKHELKSYTDPNTRQHLRQDLQANAVQGIRNLINKRRLTEHSPTDEYCRALLNRIIQKLSDAPVMITRFASDLLSRELASQSAGQQGQALEAGTPRSYITLDELINTDKAIRRFPPGQQPDTSLYSPANSAEAPDSFSYTALLPDSAGEAAARGVTYPVFRSNKNRMYAAKTQDTQPAVFGTLNLLRERNHNGLVQYGTSPGTYGDVVLVFRKNALHNCMYTLGDRMRGYTSLEPFVYNAFAPWANAANPQAHQEAQKSEALIPGYADFAPVNSLLLKLLYLGLGQMDQIMEFENLEVQIFDTVRLSREFISEVYFAGSVPDEQKHAIQNAITNTSTPEPASGTSAPRDTRFFHYAPQYQPGNSGRELILSKLYDKTSTDSPRAHMSTAQLIALLHENNYKDILRQGYGFHSIHRVLARSHAENEQYEKILQWFEKVKDYMAANPDHLDNQTLESFIAGNFVLPEAY